MGGELFFSFDDERLGVFGPVGNLLPRNETKIVFFYIRLGFPRFSTPEKQRKHKQITHTNIHNVKKKERRYRPTDCCVQQDVR